MNAKANVRLQVPSEKLLKTLIEGLGPETKAYTAKRARVTLGKDATFLVLEVEAKDTTALRSALNAYLRWIDSTMKVLAMVESS